MAFTAERKFAIARWVCSVLFETGNPAKIATLHRTQIETNIDECESALESQPANPNNTIKQNLVDSMTFGTGVQKATIVAGVTLEKAGVLPAV